MRKHACRLLFAMAYLAVAGTAIGEESLTIRYIELEEWARTRSLAAADINAALELVKAERDIDLQPSNPELGIGHQNVDGNEESEVTLGKTFEMPWISIQRRSAWKERLRAAEYKAEEQRALLLSELRTCYATVRLLDAQLSRLTHIREVLTDASHVATTRHTEGHLSGVENHLIQMTVISLQTEHQRALAERRAVEIRWRALLGAEPEKGIILVTPIDFTPVVLGKPEDYARQVVSRPGYQSRQSLQQALAKHAIVERVRFLPSFGLYGGYKKIDPNYDGYVVGVSLNLPLLNSNRAVVRKFDFERQLAANEATRYHAGQSGRIDALVTSISEAQGTLVHFKDHFEEDREALDDLLYSYEEGWLTLSDLLNAVQIEVAGLTDYFNHLVRYYQNIFELEAITGQTLVRFE